MLLQLAGFIFDCTCIILPKPIVHIDNYCYLYCSTLFIPCTALYFIPHLSYTLIKGHFENKPFIHSFFNITKSHHRNRYTFHMKTRNEFVDLTKLH